MPDLKGLNFCHFLSKSCLKCSKSPVFYPNRLIFDEKPDLKGESSDPIGALMDPLGPIWYLRSPFANLQGVNLVLREENFHLGEETSDVGEEKRRLSTGISNRKLFGCCCIALRSPRYKCFSFTR